MISDEYAYSIKNIYISRADANARHIENEDELMKVLDNYDYKRYNLTSLSLCEKISLFAGAENIVGPTGAGFTHLLFANSPNVIDFNHAFEVNEECGWNNLGDVNNATWHTIAAEKSLPPSSERPKAKNGNLIVNAKTAETVLKLLQHS
jgi:capsular polysaccharide biosynthesis protein